MRVILFILFLSLMVSGFIANAWSSDKLPTAAEAGKRLESLLPAYSNAPKDYQLVEEIGLCYYALGAAGDAASIIKATEYLQKALNLKPEANVTRAWLGSAFLFRAKDAWMMDRMTYAHQGMAFLDKAVALEPEKVSIRMIRGNNYLQAPSFMGKDQTAIEDFESALKKISEKAPVNIELAQEVNYKLGLAYKKINNGVKAKESFAAAVALAPETELARKIAKEEGGR